MRDYGSVHTCFWSNPDIQSLSDQAKLLALYLLTGPHSNMMGCFRLPTGYVAEDLNWSTETVSKRFTELSNQRFLTRDVATGWTLVPGFLAWNPVDNPNQAKSLRKLFEQVPEKTTVYQQLVEVLLQHSKHFEPPFHNHLETLSKGFRKLSRNQEQNQEKDQEQKQEQEQEQEQEVSVAQSPTDCLPETDFQLGHSTIHSAKTIISIPLNDNSEFIISEQQLGEWQALYPAVDILQTLRNIRGWNLANPKRRKTKSGVLNHISQWLAKEQNRPRTHMNGKVAAATGSTVLAHNLAVANHWLNDAMQSGNNPPVHEIVVNAETK